MGGFQVIKISDGQATAPEASRRLLEEQLRNINSPALVYFEAGWCEDCKGNAGALEEFIRSATGLEPDVTLLRVVASVSRDDWKSDAGPNWQNPFRIAPWRVESLPHAAVVRYSDGSPQFLERIMIPDSLGLGYLYKRARLLQR